jgi:hypothetical protein
LVDSLKQTEKGVEEVKITVNKDDSITSPLVPGTIITGAGIAKEVSPFFIACT